MTYSHNSVSNNLKMTTAAAATTTTRLKKNKVSNGGSSGSFYQRTTPSPPTASLPVTAHSNSIASSTNNYYQQQQQLSSSPPLSSSASSCSSSSSTSSLGSSGNGSGGYFAQRARQQQQQQQTRQWQQQRQSPPLAGGGGGSFFGNNQQQQFYQNAHGSKRHSGGGGGSAQKQRDSPRSPQGQVRQSPAIILGGASSMANAGAPARKQRVKYAMTQSPLISGSGNGTSGGKISPTTSIIPTALTHFAGSKCFDAPSPTELPKPPQHWTLSKAEQKLVGSSAGPGLLSVTTARNAAQAVDAHTYGGHVVKTTQPKRSLLDDFDTHNLKLLLNVQS